MPFDSGPMSHYKLDLNGMNGGRKGGEYLNAVQWNFCNEDYEGNRFALVRIIKIMIKGQKV